MTRKREKIADCRRVLKWLIAELETALGINDATMYTIPLLEQLNALDRLDTELAADGKDGE
jgi:hypothetical protein